MILACALSSNGSATPRFLISQSALLHLRIDSDAAECGTLALCRLPSLYAHKSPKVCQDLAGADANMEWNLLVGQVNNNGIAAIVWMSAHPTEVCHVDISMIPTGV